MFSLNSKDEQFVYTYLLSLWPLDNISEHRRLPEVLLYQGLCRHPEVFLSFVLSSSTKPDHGLEMLK